MTAGSERRDAFDASLDAPLLIEASAGTGKTFALTTLAARLIVEQERALDELLIVTFTISAAGQLRTRVRRTLQAARRAVAGGGSVPDHEQASRLRKRWQRKGIPEAEASARLTAAIRDFDRANITTIHGFCQRALGEFALHAHVPFVFGVSGGDALAVGSATRDYWRRWMVEESVALLDYAKSRSFVPNEDTTAWVAGHHAKGQDIHGAGPAEDFPGDLRSKREEWRSALRAAQAAWSDPSQRETFLAVAHEYRWLSKKRDGQRIETVVDAFDTGALEELAPDYAGFFGRKKLASRLYKQNPPPPAPLFDALQRLGEAGEEYGELWLAGQRRDLLRDARASLHHNAWAERGLSFDALLVELHRALAAERGDELARRIRQRYPVALIDEFQDTDRLQAEIFRKIYPGGADPANGRLFVVGDPKQSIYRFRGADVFAYLEAQDRLSASGESLSLAHNYRSTDGLIRAVNALFSRPLPFVLPEFDFLAAGSPEDHEPKQLDVQDAGDDPAPFQIVLIPKDAGPRRTKPDLIRLAAERAAREIARLVALGEDGRATLTGGSEGPRPVAGGDIAALVRTNRQGRAVAQALRDLGIDSVEMGTDNVFDSAEADALHRLLRALCLDESEYGATPLLRGALAADLFGLDMRELAGLRDDDDAWGRWRGRAGAWTGIWQERGIATLMRHILFAGDPDCSEHLLRYPDGPRRLTNYLHLTDLLHEAETRRRPSRQGLLDWFRRSRAESRASDETAQLRLESDEKLVKIVTVHRAKGLEYPIVFYPFAWDGRPPPSGRNRNPTAEYYDRNGKIPVLDLNPSDEAYGRERVEEHADELRLLYVALTRAECRCVVTWAPDGGAEHAPLAWLLHDRTGGDGDPVGLLDEKAARLKGLSDAEWRAEAHAFAGRADGAVSVRDLAAAPPSDGPRSGAGGSEPLAARELGRELGAIRQRTSYSALSAGAPAHAPAHDRDEVDLPERDEATAIQEAADRGLRAAPPEEGPTVHSFPRGGRSGRCLHEIFERRLGDARGESLEDTCEAALIRYGFQGKWLGVVRTLVENGLETPLVPPGEAGAVFRLSDLKQPIVELEFHLPLRKLQLATLARRLEEHGYEHRLAPGDGEIDGFLHGFIDLVTRHDGRWYAIDYKSNWLGPDLASYSEAAIARSMSQHGYQLQYLLYLTALHRLLRLRLPDYDYDRHIGGALYLFLRGMRPNAPGSGVFRDRPSRACIEAIDACFDEAP